MKKTIHMILISVMMLGGCDQKEPAVKPEIKTASKSFVVKAKKRISTTPLFFSGVIEPVSEVPVISPVNGHVTRLFFNYGKYVEKGQRLLTLSPEGLIDQYRKSVDSYLQHRDSLERSRRDYESDVVLYKAGVVSRDEYKRGELQYHSSLLNFYQARYGLEKILTKAEIDPKLIESSKITNEKSIDRLLKHKFKDIVVRAPSSGVVLFPHDSKKQSRDSQQDRLVLGAATKEQQLILTIGKLQGLAVKIAVSEININRIKTGMPVTVTGDAFPGIVLRGSVASVSEQANSNNSEVGLGQFEVVIHVPTLSQMQRKILHVGMSAKVEFDIKELPMIWLPIGAVHEYQGKTVVTVLNSSGERHEVPVIIGNTTPNEIAIVKGIRAGEKVVIKDTEAH